MVQQPKKLSDQYFGKAYAETLRGCGLWPAQPQPCALEPPWDAVDRRQLSEWDCYVNDWEASYYGGQVVRYVDEPLLVPENLFATAYRDLATIRVEQFPDDESTVALTDQLLHSLLPLQRPITFELIGTGNPPAIITQYTCHAVDQSLLDRQLSIHFPNSGVVAEAAKPPLPSEFPLQETRGSIGATLCLDHPYCFPLRTYQHLNPDPITVAIAAMERLAGRDWAMVQVSFQPAVCHWQDSLMDAIANPFKPNDYFVAIEREQLRGIQEKFASPLFAVSVRLLASTSDVFRHLTGWSGQFTNPPLQRMNVNTVDWQDNEPNENERAWLDDAVCNRTTFRCGMLLNATELATLVHLPSTGIASERLKGITSRTRPAHATPDEVGSVILGENTHRGQTRIARISASLRPRHCYIAGASGTGKSTLLLNMICQDIAAGAGVGVLDPHGDLINDILPRIPEDRVGDVVLFDPTDREHPMALNILAAADAEERERIVDETIMSLQRYFPASWGPRLERILNFAIKAVLDVDHEATIADVERILIDDEFRLLVAKRCRDPRYRRFWLDEYTKLGKNASDPVLNKLSVFLEKRVVRNIVCQRRCAVDFDKVLNGKKILLCNLSTGMLNESVANILGSFIVTKIVNAAFRRASLPKERRNPWYLYIDEFQNLMGASVGFERILAEARKYNLCLAGLANQYVGQLSPSVRQAIFGNIGAMIVFRLGIDDANTAAKEMGVFEANEIMNLELGEAVARAGGSKTAYNLRTYPEPPLQIRDCTADIRQRMHDEYATPREAVERELEGPNDGRDSANSSTMNGTQPSRQPKRGKQKTTPQGRRKEADNQSVATNKPNDPTDPNEDDLVS